MKSTIRGAVVGLAVLLTAQAAHAQAKALSVGVGGGVAIPTGTLADGNATGWTGSALVRVQPPASPLGFQVDAFYTRFGLEGVDGHSRLIGTTANAVYAFPSASMARPYLIGGLGLYNGKTTVDGLGSSDASTKFGINAGAGFDFGMGGAKLYAEARFHSMFKSVTDLSTGEEKTAYMIPITVGVRF
jgi:opacity protein-like surface antigen